MGWWTPPATHHCVARRLDEGRAQTAATAESADRVALVVGSASACACRRMYRPRGGFWTVGSAVAELRCQRRRPCSGRPRGIHARARSAGEHAHQPRPGAGAHNDPARRRRQREGASRRRSHQRAGGRHRSRREPPGRRVGAGSRPATHGAGVASSTRRRRPRRPGCRCGRTVGRCDPGSGRSGTLVSHHWLNKFFRTMSFANPQSPHVPIRPLVSCALAATRWGRSPRCGGPSRGEDQCFRASRIS